MRHLTTLFSRVPRPILTLTIIASATVALLALPTPLAAGEEAPTVEGRLLDSQGEPANTGTSKINYFLPLFLAAAL